MREIASKKITDEQWILKILDHTKQTDNGQTFPDYPTVDRVTMAKYIDWLVVSSPGITCIVIIR